MADAKMKVSQMGAVLAMDDDDLINVVTYNDQSQTYVSGKATGAKVKEYMVGDNDISALGDGSVTGAILNVKSTSETADSNIAETMAQNGAHNLLPFPYSEGSTVRSGTTYTVASDGKVTVSGTPSADPGYSYFVLAMQSMDVGAALATKFAGKQIVVSGGDTDVVGLGLQIEGFDASNNRILYDAFIVAPKLVTVPSGVVRINVTIICNADYSGSSVVIEPMIKWASDKSTEYAPYAMTNRELTENIATKTLINDTTIKFYATGNVRTLHLLGTGIGTSDNWASMLGSENLPKNTIYAPCFVSGQNTPCCIYLASNGDIKLMDYQGAPFGSAGTADVTLTWCV